MYAMYADDSTIYTSTLTPGQLERVLHEELELIKNWVNIYKLVLNTEKMKSIVIGPKHGVIL